MKKKLIIWLLLLLLTGLSLLTFKFYTETQKWEDKITISSNCNDWWKKWENKSYNFTMCMPEDWKWMHAIGWVPEPTITDDMTDIWKFENFNNSISIWNNDRLDIKTGYWYWITDPIISKIDENRLYVDWFERKDWNKLEYKGTILFFDNNFEIVSFYYNKNDEVHKKVIDSIRELK
jgi:hypothetical protein